MSCSLEGRAPLFPPELRKKCLNRLTVLHRATNVREVTGVGFDTHPLEGTKPLRSPRLKPSANQTARYRHLRGWRSVAVPGITAVPFSPIILLCPIFLGAMSNGSSWSHAPQA